MAENLRVFDGNVEEFLADIKKKDGVYFLDLYATWCGPCRNLLSRLPSIAAAYPNVTFIKHEHEKEESIGKHFGLSCFPTICILKVTNGNVELIKKFEGYNHSEVVSVLNNYK